VNEIPTAQKEHAIQELSDLIGRSKGAILTDYRGFTVAEITELRKRLRDQGAEYHVVKNTLFKRALQDGNDLHPHLEGPTAIAFALEDPVGPAKALLDFIREKRKGTVKAGFIEGQVYDEKQVEALSKLPTREVMIAQLVGGVQAPIANFVGTLEGIVSEFVRTLQAIVDKQGGGEAPAEGAQS
jgi:large subunit ribosomal protein L10